MHNKNAYTQSVVTNPRKGRLVMMRLAVTALVFFGMLMPASVLATIVYHIPTHQMAQESDVIVHAEVESQSVQWSDDRRRILTLTTLKTIQSIKGPTNRKRFTIYQVGGTLDGITYNIPGALRFQAGEEIIFFGMRHQNSLVSYGMGLGKFKIRSDGPFPVVIPEYGDVQFVKREQGQLSPMARPQPKPISLGDFIQGIRKAIGTGSVGGALDNE